MAYDGSRASSPPYIMADDGFEYPEPPAITPRVTQPVQPAIAGPLGKNPETYQFTHQSRNDPLMTPAWQPEVYLEYLDPMLTQYTDASRRDSAYESHMRSSDGPNDEYMPEASIQQVVASNPDFNPGRNVSEMDAKPRSGQSFENRIEQPSRKRPLSSSFSTGSHSAGGASSRKRHKALPQENEDSHKALAKDYGSLPSLKNLAESSGLPPAEVLRLLKSQLNSAAAASQDPVLPEWSISELNDAIKGYLSNRRPTKRKYGEQPPNAKYECTQRCGYRTDRLDDWDRHEQTHCPQKFYVCKLCKDEPKPWVTHRKDKLTIHTRVRHATTGIEGACQVDYKGDFKRGCGFCGRKFRTWEHRMKSICLHLDGKRGGGRQSHYGPKTMNDWTPEWEVNPPIEAYCDDDAADEPGEIPTDPLHGGPPEPPSEGPANGDNFVPQGQSSVTYGSGLIGASSSSTNSYSTGSGSFNNRSGTTTESEHSSNSSTTVTNQNRFVPIETIAQSSHSIVEKVREEASGILYVRKCILGYRSYARSKVHFDQEVEALRRLDHPHIIRLVETAKNDRFLSLIMSPVAEFNLDQYISDPASRSVDKTSFLGWFGCLLSGLSYIHERQIRHADIKPANILIFSRKIFIADFGLSKRVPDTASTTASISPMTPMYAAPEIANNERYGRKADIFSLGLVFFEMIMLMTDPHLTNHLKFSRHKNHEKHGTNGQLTYTSAPYYAKLPEIRKQMAVLRCYTKTPEILHLLDACKSMLRLEASERPKATMLGENLPSLLRCSHGPSGYQQNSSGSVLNIDPPCRLLYPSVEQTVSSLRPKYIISTKSSPVAAAAAAGAGAVRLLLLSMANRWRTYLPDKPGHNDCAAPQDKNTDICAQAPMTLFGGMLVAEVAAFEVELRCLGVRKVQWVNHTNGITLRHASWIQEKVMEGACTMYGEILIRTSALSGGHAPSSPASKFGVEHMWSWLTSMEVIDYRLIHGPNPTTRSLPGTLQIQTLSLRYVGGCCDTTSSPETEVFPRHVKTFYQGRKALRAHLGFFTYFTQALGRPEDELREFWGWRMIDLESCMPLLPLHSFALD